MTIHASAAVHAGHHRPTNEDRTGRDDRSAEPRMTIHASAAVHAGHHRPTNEDRVLADSALGLAAATRTGRDLATALVAEVRDLRARAMTAARSRG